MRRFDQLDERAKIDTLLTFSLLGMRELIDDTDNKLKGNYISLAIEYGNRWELVKSDFDLIRNLTFDEIAKKIVSL